MALLPDFQNRGIGSLPVKEGVRLIMESDHTFIAVLGHEGYYSMFGFERASKYNISAKWEGAREGSFMVMHLNRSAMAGVSGVVKYRNEFNEAM